MAGESRRRWRPRCTRRRGRGEAAAGGRDAAHCVAGLVASSTAPSTAPRGPPPGRGLAEKNTPAQPRLRPSGSKAPRAGVSAGSVPGAAAAFGNKAWPRSFHVIIGASVHPRVVAREQEGQRPAVRPARHAHPRITRAVLYDLGTGGQPVHERAGVRDLVVRGVQRDLPPTGAEPARRPREHDEPRSASARASASTEAFVPPNPWATSTAGAGVVAGRYRVVSRAIAPSCPGPAGTSIRSSTVRDTVDADAGTAKARVRSAAASRATGSRRTAARVVRAGRACHGRDGGAGHRQFRGSLSRFSVGRGAAGCDGPGRCTASPSPPSGGIAVALP